MEIILNSVYTQELQLNPEIVLGVLEAAHRLEFTEVCHNFSFKFVEALLVVAGRQVVFISVAVIT